MNARFLVAGGLILLILSQVLLAQGYDFLMAQKPIDFAHWAMLIASVLLFALWFSLPANFTKKAGLLIMSLGIAGIAGMCVIDFILWSLHGQPDLKHQIFTHITSTPSLRLPFLIIGPALFYSGICIATYGLIQRYTWQVVTLNIGGLMIGLGHMIMQNALIPAIGAILLTGGMLAILFNKKTQYGAL